MKGLKTTIVCFTLLFLTACVTIQTSPPWPAGSEPVAVKVISSNIGLRKPGSERSFR